MQVPSKHNPRSRTLERSLAVIGTGLCLVVSVGAWLILRKQQSLWPLPDLYLLEMLAASGVAAWGIWSSVAGSAGLRGLLTWTAIGAMLGFVVLGSFSIGFFYLPGAILLVIGASLADVRVGANSLMHLAIGLAAAVIQAALMLVVIRIM